MTSKCKTLLITGGSSGIGQATARLFVDKGWQVFELSRSGKNENGIVHVDCDVTHQDQVRHAVASVLEQTKQIDVLISNAGFGISGSVEFTNSEDLHRQFDVNLFGSIYVVQAVLPVMRSQNFGRIIFVSSVAAIFPIPFQAFY
ncbi:MAG: SDR family NAD(P)-dependent oxidoreductase, partial [Paludibacteraceae bacterium]|nr:SDR family NAD(P)-dependent oxidoreductase [Paludibacteraceae bacterium]